MRKSIWTLITLMVMLTLALSACGQASTPAAEQPAAEESTQEEAQVEEPAQEEETQAEAGLKVCQVTDTGGIDDKSFNATAWKGVEQAEEQLGAEGKYLESQQQTDYDKNITQFLQEGCDLIVTVGFLLGDATAKYAQENPDVPFTIVDFAYDPPIDNVLGQVFNTDEAAFLAGYLAASQTETGVVGTWGGIAIPPVTVFMDGFLAGVNYYNEQNGTDVQVLGWDGTDGLFINNFESAEDGKKASASLADEGADIIMPVAGPAGLGAGAVAKERGLKIIGVDSDWYDTAPEYQDQILTSVLKNMNVTVLEAAKMVQDGTFEGGVIVGTLENGGVGLASLHNFEDQVSDEVQAELESLKQEVAAGDIQVSDYLPGGQPPAEEAMGESLKVCQVTDTGGIDDKSFNATAWKGVEQAEEQLGAEGKYLESQQQTDYDKNITQFLQEGCDLIVTVGFLLGDATAKYAQENPDVPFTIVDFAYDPPIDNVLGQVFNTDEAAFLAGYLAASQTETGVVGTWGGIAIPPVTVFMDGFLAGVNYYNEQNGTDVQVLGWDGTDGLFINNFESAEDGKKASASLADEGADIIMPVAGPAGLGAGAVAKERGLKIIGVDSDWYDTAPEYQDQILTSVLKNMNVTVLEAAKMVQDGTFEGGVIVGTLENGGVGLASLHNFEDQVSDEVQAELESLKQEVAAGDIQVSDYLNQ